MNTIKQISNTITAFALVLAVSNAHTHGNKEHSQITTTQLQGIMSSYFDVVRALANDDEKSAMTVVNKIISGKEKYPSQLSHSIKASAYSFILMELSKAKNLEGLRAILPKYSELILTLASEIQKNGDPKIYQFFCPMANHHAGAFWLGKDSVIANPYFGKEMPSCGSLVKPTETQHH